MEIWSADETNMRKYIHSSWCWWTKNMVSWWNWHDFVESLYIIHGVDGQQIWSADEIDFVECIDKLVFMGSMDKFRNSVVLWVNIIYNVGDCCSNKCVRYIYRVCWIIQVMIYFCNKIKYAHKTKTQQIFTYPSVKQINCNTDSKSKNYLLPFAFMK